jgi:hypothetical protein
MKQITPKKYVWVRKNGFEMPNCSKKQLNCLKTKGELQGNTGCLMVYLFYNNYKNN